MTPHHAGDQVVALIREDQRYGRVRVGDVGTIRRMYISDPNDGDETFPMFYVRVRRGTVLLHPTEFAPADEAEAHLWARRQIDGLGADALR